jgi:hypothetical protein
MTQQSQSQKLPVRRKLSQDLLDELNMLSALASRAADLPATTQQK